MNLEIFWGSPEICQTKNVTILFKLGICLFLTTLPWWILFWFWISKKNTRNLNFFGHSPEIWWTKIIPILFKLGMLFSKKATISPIKKPSAWKKLAPHQHCMLQKRSYHQKNCRPFEYYMLQKLSFQTAVSPPNLAILFHSSHQKGAGGSTRLYLRRWCLTVC